MGRSLQEHRHDFDLVEPGRELKSLDQQLLVALSVENRHE
jgi:hypothetical protein